jgi:spiro-SPASM protein
LDVASDVILAVWADVKTSPLGQESKLLRRLSGTEVLRRTAQRIARVRQAGTKVIFCPTNQREQIELLVAGLPVNVQGVDFNLPGYWAGIQSARKWAKTGWRGGLMGACYFDEDLLPAVQYGLAKQCAARSMVVVPAAAALVDPEIIDRQIEQHLSHRDDYKIAFTQTPPGLSGAILTLDLLGQLAQTGQLAGSALAYLPDSPKPDFISRPCNLSLDPSITQMAVRLICDSNRSMNLMDQLLNELPEESLCAKTIVDWVRQNGLRHLSHWPDEIEIELVSGWATPSSYRPTSDRGRGPIDAERLMSRIAELTGECDDLLVTLGGFGEPTKHPEFGRIVAGLKEAGVWGICLATAGLFDEKTAETIVDLPIDVVLVHLDVPEPALYQQVMGVDGYQKVIGNIDRLLGLRGERRQPLPLVIPEMVKTHATIELMEEFAKTWTRRVGWGVIQGYSDYAGQLGDLAVSSMAPPRRRPCRRLWSNMTILADGNVAVCDRDFQGKTVVGSINNHRLIDLWQGQQLGDLREAHLAGRYEANNLCPACRHWHRY